MRTRYQIKNGKIHNGRCEINIVEHCNLACRACTHLSPIAPKHLVDPDAIYRDLLTLGRVYHANWLRLLGGEPLLHPHLLDVIRAGKQASLADRVCIVTNGTLLPRMPSMFWQEIHAVEVCLYPEHNLEGTALAQCHQAAKAHDVDLRLVHVREFRESYSEIGTPNDQLTARIYQTCHVAHLWRCHTVANGYFYKCPQSYFLPKLTTHTKSRPSDRIKIKASNDFGERLLDYLHSDEPLSSCRNCLGTAGKRFPHAQVKRAEFRKPQTQPTENLIDERYLAQTHTFLAPLRAKLSSTALRLPVLKERHRLK